MGDTGSETDGRSPNKVAGTNMAEWNGPEIRYDLAFPVLTEDMVQRLKAYGEEESFPGNVTLYTHGDRQIDMFVVLNGGVDVYLPAQKWRIQGLRALSRVCIYRETQSPQLATGRG
jgi:thioredoxin reductase (NADPH)